MEEPQILLLRVFTFPAEFCTAINHAHLNAVSKYVVWICLQRFQCPRCIQGALWRAEVTRRLAPPKHGLSLWPSLALLYSYNYVVECLMNGFNPAQYTLLLAVWNNYPVRCCSVVIDLVKCISLCYRSGHCGGNIWFTASTICKLYGI